MENENTSKEMIMEMARNWKPPEKRKRGRKSKLDPYIDTIRYMRSARHLSHKQIHSFVLESGINLGYQSFLNFVKRNVGNKKSN